MLSVPAIAAACAECEVREGVICNKKAKWLSKERREVKSKGERERYTELNAEFQRIARRGKKVFLSEQ